MRVVGVYLAENHQLVAALGDGQLIPLDAGERFEGRAGRPPAVAAMAIRGIEEFIGDRVADGAAETSSGERAARCRGIRHAFLPAAASPSGLFPSSLRDLASNPRRVGAPAVHDIGARHGIT